MPTIFYSGDTKKMTVTLKTATGGVYAVSATAVVDAALLTGTGVAITATETQSSASPADWPNGVLAIAFSATESDKAAAYDGQTIQLEIQVDEGAGGKQTFRTPLLARAGVIS